MIDNTQTDRQQIPSGRIDWADLPGTVRSAVPCFLGVKDNLYGLNNALTTRVQSDVRNQEIDTLRDDLLNCYRKEQIPAFDKKVWTELTFRGLRHILSLGVELNDCIIRLAEVSNVEISRSSNEPRLIRLDAVQSVVQPEFLPEGPFHVETNHREIHTVSPTPVARDIPVRRVPQRRQPPVRRRLRAERIEQEEGEHEMEESDDREQSPKEAGEVLWKLIDRGIFDIADCYAAKSKIVIDVSMWHRAWGLVSTLWLASLYGRTSIVKSLIDRTGADVNKSAVVLQSRPDLGSTPLYVASLRGFTSIVQLLIDNGADVNRATVTGEVPLAVAAQNGHLEVVKVLSRREDTNVDQENNTGMTALNISARSGQVEMVRVLIEAGADVNKADNDGITPLVSAVEKGYCSVISMLVDEGADLTKATTSGITPMLKAAQLGRSETMEVLIRGGAEINGGANDTMAPLLACTENNQCVTPLKLLLDNGADIHQSDATGTTPFLSACAKGNYETVEFLLGRGAIISGVNINGEGPLYMAASAGSIEVLNLLLDHGAEITAVTPSGKGAIHAAARMGHVDVFEKLVDRGVAVNLPSNSGETPLSLALDEGRWDLVMAATRKGAVMHPALVNKLTGQRNPLLRAAKDGNIEMMRLLLDNGARVNMSDNTNRTALHWATSCRHFNVMELLLQRGAAVDATKSTQRDTPLHIASRNGELAQVELLSSFAKDRLSPSNYSALINEAGIVQGTTPLLLACSGGYADVARYLIQAGAKVDAVKSTEGTRVLCIASGNGHLPIVNLLLEGGADPNARGQNGRTALYTATTNGRKEVVDALIKAGAKVDLADDQGRSPLFAASQRGLIGVVAALLAAGADPLKKNLSDEDPRVVAAHCGHEDVLEALLAVPGGSELTNEGDHRVSALLSACNKGHQMMVDVLLGLPGFDVNAVGKYDGETPLYVASRNGFLEIVNSLLDKGADPTSVTKSFAESALYAASEQGHLDIVKVLLARGAKETMNHTTKEALTAVCIAAKNGFVEVVTELKLAGAHTRNAEDHARNAGQTAVMIALRFPSPK